MEELVKIHVGLDVPKGSIGVAAAGTGRASARLIGKVTHDVDKLLKVLAKICAAEQLHIVHETGSTGFTGASSIPVARPRASWPRTQAFCSIGMTTAAARGRKCRAANCVASCLTRYCPAPSAGHAS